MQKQEKSLDLIQKIKAIFWDNDGVLVDTERGLAAALGAGIKCVIVRNRITSHGTFSGAYRIFDNIKEVAGTIGKDRITDNA